MKAQWNWRVVAMVLGVFLVAAAGWVVVPSVAEAASCATAPAPCVEDPALDLCVGCHSISVAGGNRNGTDRKITVSAASNRHILGPPQANWLSDVQGMLNKGAGAQDQAARIAAYLNTNYATNCPQFPATGACLGPILSSPTISDVQSNSITLDWITSADDYGDLPADSCVLYGTTLIAMTGDTCDPADPSYDPDGALVVTNHSVTIQALQPLTQYFLVHRSTDQGAQTTTWAGATSVTTLPGGGPPGPSELGTIVSLTVGSYNGDSHVDIGVGVSTKNHVIPFMGSGTGGFTAGTTLANVGTTPSAIASGGVKGDFNEDGMDDLAVANFGAASRNIAIFLGASPGFQTTAVSTIPLADPPTGVAIGDFTEDGVLDIAVATVQLDGAMGHLIIYAGENNGGVGTGNFTGPINTYNVEISTVLGPTITSIVPDTVDCTGLPATITINGSLLFNTATVKLDNVLTLPVISGSPDNTSLVVSVPATAEAGIHSVVVTLGSLPPASHTLVIAPRTISVVSISPVSKTYGLDAAGQVLVSGSNFTVGATVSIGPLSGTTVQGSTASATTPFVFQNSSIIRVYVTNTAMPPGVYDVTVENTDACAGTDTLENAFTMIAPQPVVAAISQPNVTYGVTASQSLTISGSGFMSGAVINVGGLTGATVPGTGAASATTPFVYVSSTTLRFWWPNTSLPPASYSVDVTNPSSAGGATGSLANGFTVQAPEPTISSVTPTPVTYGVTPNQSVTIFGSNFLQGATITVGSLVGTTVVGTTASATTPFVHVNSSQVKFYWPNSSLTPSEYDVQVTNPVASGGLSAILPAAFDVQGAQPSVNSVSPTPVTYGITANSSIAIFGSNFVLGATITVGTISGQTVASTGAATAAMPFVFVNNSQLRFYWPNTALSPLAYTVQVINPVASGNLSASLPAGFTVTAPQPTITNLSPDSRTYGITASSQITVFGSNFIVGAQVTIGSLSGTTVAGSSATATVPFVHSSAGQIKFWWPNTALSPGVYAIQVTNPSTAGSLSATLATALTVVAPQPTVTSATPTPRTYGVDASASITVFGTNFINGATITVGSLSGATVTGNPATATTPFVYVSSSQLKFWWPNTSLAPGSYSITVTNPVAAGGLAETLANGFVVTAPAPSIAGLTPTPVTFGSTSRSIMITGANFVAGGTITVGSLSGTTVIGGVATATIPYVWQNSTTLRFWWPSTSLPVGPYDVVVTNPGAAGGLSTTSTGGFVVQ